MGGMYLADNVLCNGTTHMAPAPSLNRRLGGHGSRHHTSGPPIKNWLEVRVRIQRRGRAAPVGNARCEHPAKGGAQRGGEGWEREPEGVR
jgi:hypothetical protein